MATVTPKGKPDSCAQCGNPDLQWAGMGFDREHDPAAKAGAGASDVEQVIRGRIDTWKCTQCGHTVDVRSEA